MTVSRGTDILQVLSLGQDEVIQSGADLADATFAQLDTDCNGTVDLILYPTSDLDGRSPYVLVWPFDAAKEQFAPEPHVFFSARRWVAPADGDASRTTIQLLSGVDPATMEPTGAFPILVRRGTELIDFVPNRTHVSLPDDGLQATPLVDVSSDGHLDLVLPTGGADNSYFSFWLFDPVALRFVFNAALSQLASPVVDPATGEITEFHNRGAAGAEHRTARYRFEHGALEKVWESEQTDASLLRLEPSLQGLGLFRRLVRVYRGGRPKVVCEAFVEPESGDVVALVAGEEVSCSEEAPRGADR